MDECIEFYDRDRSLLDQWNDIASLSPSHKKLTLRQYIAIFQKCIWLDSYHRVYVSSPGMQEYNWLGLRLLVQYLGGLNASEQELDTTENKLDWYQCNYYIHIIASILSTSERKVYETILAMDQRE